MNSTHKALVLYIIISVLDTSYCFSQVFYRRTELGFCGGTAHYFGDLNQNLGFAEIGKSAGVFYRYNATRYIGLKLNAGYANLGYDDKHSSNPYQKMRNLNFKTNIFEVLAQAEFNFFEYTVGDFDKRFTPYVSLGVGAFRYDPYTTYNGKVYYLRPLGTEGQNFDEYKDRRYKPWSMAFPIGIGIKYWWNYGITVTAEIINRSTMTDYLDDVSTTYVGIDLFTEPEPGPYPYVGSQLQDRSIDVTSSPIGFKGRQRGISSTKDQYMFFQLGVSYRLPTYKCPANQL